MAVANYECANGHYPPAFVLGPNGKPWHSWRVLLLPYLEQDDSFKQYRFDEPWDGPNNRLLADRMPKMYCFHNRTAPSRTTNYLAVVGPKTMWPGHEARKRIDIRDPASETVLVVENRGAGVHWMEPRDLDFDTLPMMFNHSDGVSSWYKTPAVVTVDGSVLTFPPQSDPIALRAALTATGGESVSLDASGWRILPDGRLRDEAK